LIESCGHKILSAAGLFTAKLSALITAQRHIAEVVRPRERCLIHTDSLCLIKTMLSRRIAHRTHPLVYECKRLCWSLYQINAERCRHDRWHWKASFSKDHCLPPSFARLTLMRAWQAKWDSAGTGRFAHIFGKVGTLICRLDPQHSKMKVFKVHELSFQYCVCVFIFQFNIYKNITTLNEENI
jgi:hypothetical protein